MRLRKNSYSTKFTKNISSELEKRSGAVWSMLPFKKLIILIIIINIAVGTLAVFIQKFLPPELPLYFGLPQGVAQLSPSIGLIIPTAVSLSLSIINITLTLFISNDYLKKALVVASAGLTFFSVIAIVKIAQLVGSF